jgi:Flp pilus assembly protein TadG
MNRQHGERREQQARRRKQRGAVLVEAALIMPVLIMLAMGTIEFGLGWRDRVGVQTSVRAAARSGATLGSDSQADYNMLQTLKSGLGTNYAKTVRVVIYKASATDGSVPAACLSGSSQSGVCNVYAAADLVKASTSFGCGVGAVDTAWCPTSRISDIASASGLDYVGVYIEFSHSLITGSFGTGSISIKDRVVMRVEPN